MAKSKSKQKPVRDDLKVDFTIAVWGGRNEVLKKMLAKNPEAVSWRDKDGGTPLRHAIAHGSPGMDTVRLLVDSGSDINAQDDAGMTPLMFTALHAARECLDYLLHRGADTALKDENGRTAATIALETGYPDIAVKILEHEEKKKVAAEAARQVALEKDSAQAHSGLAQPITVHRPLAFGPRP